MRSEESARVRAEPRTPDVQMLARAGAAGSALRVRLRSAGIDPKLARLMLLFDGHTTLRVSEVAWRLNVSKATASRHLDRAERAGLVDKLYLPLDRRGTWARSTRRGRELRAAVVEHLTRSAPFERPYGPAYGIRATPRYLVEE
jgi:DNA-binding MarR family transcriptional regulator